PLKGDFTRTTFKKEKHYSSVRMQQGRVQLDADWNEQVDIQTHRHETEGTDTIGACGVPKDNPGFELIPDGKTIKIAKGRLYVDGMLCENEKDVTYEQQPEFHGQPLPTVVGPYVFYLDVWQRHLTSVEEPGTREVALNGVDTTTRTKTVWQVKFMELPGRQELINFCGRDFPDWTDLVKSRSARLAVRVRFDARAVRDPCVLSPRSGFRGAENQLYRVEIHTPGAIGTAKFKWARDNARVVHAIENLVDNKSITICEPARDELLRFAPGDWVEVIDDTHELNTGAGAIVRLTNVEANGTKLIFDRHTATEPITNLSFPKKQHPRVRRWNQRGKAELKTASRWIPLEDGIEVKFGDGDEYQTGDYWVIPARTITGNVDWPLDGNDKPALQQRFGIEHHFCRIAILSLDANGNWNLNHDCRQLFSPLAEQRNLFYVSGDGQESLAGLRLLQPLVVGVTNGQLKSKGAQVKFKITVGNGKISLKEDREGVNTPLIAITDSEGLARCYFDLDEDEDVISQQVEARLLDAAGEESHLPLLFNANVSRAIRVAIYDVPDCGDQDAPTVRSLFEDLVAGWPDVDGDGQVTIKDIFDALLCHLEAYKLPFLDQSQPRRFPDDVKTIGRALETVIPPGTIMAFANTEAPVGWLECDGREITEAGFPELYDKIKDRFAPGDPVTVPDLRGVFVRGWDHDRGEDPGRTFGDLQEDQIQTHKHNEVPPTGHNHSLGTVLIPGEVDGDRDGSPKFAATGAAARTDSEAVQLGEPAAIIAGQDIKTGAETRPKTSRFYIVLNINNRSIFL
ncbi:MAG: DUF6519 domain-containing protein, partial [bacterium]